jgi:hypothetical protein
MCGQCWPISTWQKLIKIKNTTRETISNNATTYNNMMIKQLSLLLALIGAPAVSAIELTPANWDEQTSGKTVFLKFYAPWVSYSYILLPHWMSRRR